MHILGVPSLLRRKVNQTETKSYFREYLSISSEHINGGICVLHFKRKFLNPAG